MTVMFFCVDAALFFNSYVNPIALDAINWKYYIVYDCWLAFELGIVLMFYIETRNTPLEEIVKYFDGESALLGGDLATEKAKHYLVEETHAHDEKNTTIIAHEETSATSPEIDSKDTAV
jgi:hypothetical protein